MTKSQSSGLLWKHCALGLFIGIAFVVPEFLLFHRNGNALEIFHISKATLSKLILLFYPIILVIISYKFGKARLYLIKSNEKQKENEQERRQLLEGLYEYKFALDESSIVTVIDDKGKIKRANQKFEQLTGLSSADVIGRSIWRLPSSLQKEHLFQNIKAVVDTGQVWKGEIVYYNVKGDCYTNAIVVPLSKNKGGNNDCLVIQYDITREKKAEMALRKMEEENKVILANTQTLICTHDAEGVLLTINHEGAKMLGTTPNQLKGQSIKGYLGDKISLQDYLSNILTNGYAEGIFKVTGHDGTKRSLLFKNVVCQRQGKPYIIGSAVDITQTVQAQKELENQRSFISLIIDKSPNMIFVVNETNELSYVNKIAKSYFGLPNNKSVLTIDSASLINEYFRQLFPLGKATFTHELVNLNEECQLYNKSTQKCNWFKVQKTSFANNKGNKFLLVMATDITEKNFAERELIEAKKMVEKILLAKEQFFANMSHEIRTPLNSIIGFSHLMEDTALDENQMDYLQTIKIAGKNLLSIINDVLDLSKMVTGNLTLSNERMNLQEVVKNVARLFGTKVVEKNIFLKLAVSNSIPKNLFGDEDRLNQVLINLVSNAVKFTNQGGVKILVEQVVGVDKSRAYIRFEVKDTGIGIAKDKSKLIFQRFTQANNQIHKTFGGTGLGLNIVKNLIELFGGDITVESELNCGTSVIVIVPFEIDKQVRIPQTDALPYKLTPWNEKPLHILLADDNNTNAKLAKRILEKKNCTVVHVRDGLEVLSALDVATYDLILMDVQMINLDGIETTRIIRARKSADKNIPIIALTAHSFVGKIDICAGAGMNDYVSKPFSPDQLFNSIGKVFAETANNTQLITN